MTSKPIHIIGAGLAGSEAAWQIANAGTPVILHEMRGVKGTAAHKTDGCAELVCSNSFRSDDAEYNAVGLLHQELRKMNSLILREGDKAAVPAGGALAVDRDIFSAGVTKALEDHPLITIERGEIAGLPPQEWESVIIATGPLTSDPLAKAIQDLTGEDELAFFDALAPIVHAETIDMSRAWFQSRYDKEGPAGTGKDYINCPMTKEEYSAFIDALLGAEYGLFKDWELPSCSAKLGEEEKDTPYFEGCMPVEIMAERGRETLRFGPMKPIGLFDPHKKERPYAVVQLRQDNALGTLYNIVGFQTKMKWGEQARVFKMIPGLENAEFARFGGLHRNTFINSPKLLEKDLRLKKPLPPSASPFAEASADRSLLPPAGGGARGGTAQTIRFAGQITGCEGYVESASVGLMAGLFAVAELRGGTPDIPPLTTAMGALLNHITGGADAETFQPMNVNFGLMPEPDEDMLHPAQPNGKRRRLKGKDRKKAYTDRARRDFDLWLGGLQRKAA